MANEFAATIKLFAKENGRVVVLDDKADESGAVALTSTIEGLFFTNIDGVCIGVDPLELIETMKQMDYNVKYMTEEEADQDD